MRETPLKAIRAKCLDCSCESVKEVRECTVTDCALWNYRMGTNPSRSGLGGGGNAEALRKYHENKKAKDSLHENKIGEGVPMELPIAYGANKLERLRED